LPGFHVSHMQRAYGLLLCFLEAFHPVIHFIFLWTSGLVIQCSFRILNQSICHLSRLQVQIWFIPVLMEVTGCYIKYPCTGLIMVVVVTLVSGFFSFSVQLVSMCCKINFQFCIYIICLHYKYVNFICPFHMSALPARSGVLRQEWIAHLRSTFSSCRYRWGCVSTVTSTLGCSMFGLRPDHGLLV
jgi:hypothetical protein